MAKKTTEYRDPFEEWDQAIGSNTREDPLAGSSGYKRPMDYIPVAKVRLRGRKWEKRNKARSFRCVSPDLQDDIRTLAKKEQLPVDDVANALLDYSLSCYRNGQMNLDAELCQYRRTVMPERGWDGKPRVYWLEQRWVPDPKRRAKVREKQMKSQQPWKDWPIVAYRLSPDVLRELDAIRERLQVPMGEIVTRLFIKALQVYAEGNLMFKVEDETEEPGKPAAGTKPESEHKLNEQDWKPK